jgi:hypothetical protein
MLLQPCHVLCTNDVPAQAGAVTVDVHSLQRPELYVDAATLFLSLHFLLVLLLGI